MWILNYLCENQIIKTKTIVQQFDIHRDTAIQYLNSLGDEIIKKVQEVMCGMN